ncbi:SGNH/GDSL hydrolase family protein [Myxococcota bacterium]|nr:SGNH/GDSL hydrolase family protein [Myxococcota bacterium]
MSEARTSRGHSSIARFLTVLAGTGIGLGLVEGICRLAVEDGAHSPATLWGSPLIPKEALDLREAGTPGTNNPYIRIDRKLGWSIVPGGAIEEPVPYRADASGLRMLPGAPATPSGASSLRIAAYGDSFTHCDEVAFEDCWTRMVESERGARVFNAGVPGYGTDQAYLRYLETKETLAPDVVVLGLMIGDVKRNVNVFRTFLAEWTTWSKPRFILAGDGIELVNRPTALPTDVPEMIASGHPLLALDWWYDPAEWRRDPMSWSVAYRFVRGRLWRPRERPGFYAADGEPVRVTARIVEAFARDVEAAGGRFICLVIPSRPDLGYSDPGPWQPLIDLILQAGIEIVDPTLDLQAHVDSPELFAPLGHYARLGNEILARAVVQALARDPILIGGHRKGAASGSHEDGIAEEDTIGVYDRRTGTFFLRNANSKGTAEIVEPFGRDEGAIPAMGDFDGNGTDTFGLYSPEQGEFVQRDLNAGGPAARRFRFGGIHRDQKPVIGNWDGLGGDSVGVYDPIHGRFVLRNSNSSGLPDVVTRFGPRNAVPAPIPLAGNWSGGDAIDGIGLYSPSTGRFSLRDDPTTSGPPDYSFGFGPGGRGLVPIVGDWDSDGADEIGLYDPAERSFFLQMDPSDGPAERAFRFGEKGLAPVAGNFDGR